MDKRNIKYSLQKYAGMKTKHICPKCGKRSFTLFVDSNGIPLDKTVGRCDHECRCGYIRTPREYFAEHPDKRATSFDKSVFRPQPQRQPDFIPDELVEKSMSLGSNFGKFLSSIIDTYPGSRPHLERIQDLYQLGSTKDGSCVFWQKDVNGHIRTGKVIQYDPQTGHRSHEAGGINWIHAIMKRRGLLKPDFNLQQGLFGEHLLPFYPDAGICLVESEKTAVLGSVLYPLQIWLSVGSAQNFKPELLKVLSGRNVTVFPDVCNYKPWEEKASKMPFANFRVFNIDDYADDTDRERKSDVGDWFIELLKKRYNRNGN